MKTIGALLLVGMLTFGWTIGCSDNSAVEESAQSPQQEETVPADPQQTVGTLDAQTETPSLEDSTAGTAPEESMDQTAAEAEDIKVEDAAPDATAGRMDEISGTLVKTDDGIALFSDSGNYLVAGQDLTEMIGQNVKVTGMVEENDGKSTITVSSVVVIE